MMFLAGVAGFSAVAAQVDLSRAFIVVGRPTAPAARLGAVETQYWLQKITGTEVPIITDDQPFPAGMSIFVGDSSKLPAGLPKLEGLKYQVKIADDAIVLRGVDAPQSGGETIDYGAVTAGKPNGVAVVLPKPMEQQGTLRAVYNFLENALDIRFYGPREISVCYTPRKPLLLESCDIVREPSFKHFTGSYTFAPEWATINGLYGNPSREEGELYLRRRRFGGIPWYTNHTMYAYQKRFCKEFNDPMFECDRPEFFPPEGGAKSRQLCYSSDALAEQVAKDAIDYFSGKQVPGVEVPPGSDFFPVVPNDAGNYCRCDKCMPVWSKDAKRAEFFDGTPLFGSGQASNYWFAFVNKVAKRVKEVYPDKYISTLAYEEYFYPPDFPLENNIAVAPCVTPRLAMCEKFHANEERHYAQWLETSRAGKVGPIFLWNYFCFPDEVYVPRGEIGFPGFTASQTGELMKRYAADGVWGIFFCGVGEQLDFYMISRAMNNVDFDTAEVLDEFFTRYFGAAAKPMRRFYDIIEKRYFNPPFYKENRIEGHQTQKIAWELLATPEVMAQLGEAMAEAKAAAVTPEEKARVGFWDQAVWQRMQQGSKQYLDIMSRLKALPEHNSVAPDYIVGIDANASWQYEVSSYTLTTGMLMQEKPEGELGSREALFYSPDDPTRPWSGLGRDGTWVEFDLGAPYDLEEIRIWNYQQSGSQTDRGMRQVSITASPSLNFSDWREVYSGIIPRGEEGKPFPASLVVKLPAGTRVRYVRITSKGAPGVGNWGNTVYSSLGQVRFYGKKVNE